MDGKKAKMLQEEELDFGQHSYSSSIGVAVSRRGQGTRQAPRLLEGPKAAALRRQLRNEGVPPQGRTGRTKPSLQSCWWVGEEFELAQG